MSDCITQQSQTRPRWDAFHQMDDMRITSYQLRYMLNQPAINCPTTFPVQPTTRIQYSGDSWKEGKWRTDVETDLKGINRFGNRVRCDEKLYNPDTNKFNSIPLEHAQDGSFPLNFNRLHNPPCTLRTTGWNRWQPLFHDPQATFEQPFDFFIPSRDVDKKLYQTRKNKPTPNDLPSYNGLADQSKFGPRNAEGTEQGVF